LDKRHTLTKPRGLPPIIQQFGYLTQEKITSFLAKLIEELDLRVDLILLVLYGDVKKSYDPIRG
jgi:hypothetical protein